MTATKMAQIITYFNNLNAVISADYLDRDVLSSLYQQVDPVYPDESLPFQVAAKGVF